MSEREIEALTEQEPRGPCAICGDPRGGRSEHECRHWVKGRGYVRHPSTSAVPTCPDCGAELTQPQGQEPWPCAHCHDDPEQP